MRCDYCISDELLKIYKPKGSLLGCIVYVCRSCGLTQSFKKLKKKINRKKRISGNADWGNIRYGKAFRTNKTLNILKRNSQLRNIKNCLDIGSNRGSFINSLLNIKKNINFVGIEPDKNLQVKYPEKKVKIFNEKFENIQINKKFDLIHCSHTLEHLDSPSFFFKSVKNLMHNKTILYLEVPNIKSIISKYCLEEYFIDKHAFHFSENDIRNYFKKYNYKIIKQIHDEENLIFLIKINRNSKNATIRNNFLENKKMIQKYKKTIRTNLEKMKKLKYKFKKLILKKSILFWGAGRIFNVMQEYVGLQKFKEKVYVCDQFLPDYSSYSSGFKIYKPYELSEKKFDYIFITARSFEKDIKKNIELLFRKKNKMIQVFSIFKY